MRGFLPAMKMVWSASRRSGKKSGSEILHVAFADAVVQEF